MESTGRLLGPELACQGGNTYRAGDHVVTLAPGPGGSLVTSERAVVEAVQPASGAVELRTGDGRRVRLTGEEAGDDRLGYGYATTVHRSQGATVARAHLFADGGGRELADVAMSRARESSHAWVVADDLDQAAEDLSRDWSSERTPTWAIDTGLPAADKLTSNSFASLADDQRVQVAAVAHAQTKITANALTRIGPSALVLAVADARAAQEHAQQARADLATGSGVYQHTDAGRAVADLTSAQIALTAAQRTAEDSQGWRDRRSSAKQLAGLIQREAEAHQSWKTHVAPEAARLDALIARLQDSTEQLTACEDRQEEAAQKLAEQARNLRRRAARLAVGLDAYRNQADGIPRRPAPRPSAARSRLLPVRPPTFHHEQPDAPILGPRP